MSGLQYKKYFVHTHYYREILILYSIKLYSNPIYSNF
nr:MAG TPA: hypothetical protein [Crassvirales sp.]